MEMPSQVVTFKNEKNSESERFPLKTFPLTLKLHVKHRLSHSQWQGLKWGLLQHIFEIACIDCKLWTKSLHAHIPTSRYMAKYFSLDNTKSIIAGGLSAQRKPLLRMTFSLLLLIPPLIVCEMIGMHGTRCLKGGWVCFTHYSGAVPSLSSLSSLWVFWLRRSSACSSLRGTT